MRTGALDFCVRERHAEGPISSGVRRGSAVANGWPLTR
jgi:hypothetical protein